MNELTEKHKLFIQEYLIDFNGTRAYMAVYPDSSYDSARADACRLLTNASVQEAISQAQEERKKRIQITQDEILADLKEVKDRCLQKIPVLDKQGNETGEYVFKEQGVLKACELLGKHLKMFTEKVEHSGKIDIPQAQFIINGKIEDDNNK